MYSITYDITSEDIQSDYNHVHHAHSLCLMEKARLAYLEHIGQPNEDLFKKNLFLVLTNIDVSYKRELFAGPVEITCENMTLDGKIFSMFQRIIRGERSKTAVEARVSFACMDGVSKRAILPPDDLMKAFLGGS